MDSNDAYLFDFEPAQTRVCGKCKEERPLSAFYLDAEARASAKAGKRIRRPCRYCQRHWDKHKAQEGRWWPTSIRPQR